MSLVSRIAPALLLTGLLALPAAAAPVGPNVLGQTSDSLLIQVRDAGHGGKGGGGHHGNRGKAHPGKAHHGGRPQHGGRGHVNHGNRYHGGRYHGGGRWVAGRSYYVAPPGWRRYGGRPYNWQTLGCVVVNGLWFCP